MHELPWEFPVIGYLFLAGLGAGAMTVSASVLLRGGTAVPGGRYVRIAAYGALVAPITVSLGTFLLVFELGQPFRALNLFKVINPSPMSIGSWLLAFCIALSVVYAFCFLDFARILGRWREPLRRALAWVCIPIGIGTAVYTGVLLGAMPARPFWNSPLLALLFFVSALSTGTAIILFLEAALRRPMAAAGAPADDESGYLLSASDTMLIGFELLSIFLFLMFAHLTIGDVKHAVAVILPGGELAAPFWVGVVLIGLVAPGLIELRYVVPRLLYNRPFHPPRPVELAATAAVLIGGFMLRYVVVIAGQVTGPVGI